MSYYYKYVANFSLHGFYDEKRDKLSKNLSEKRFSDGL